MKRERTWKYWCVRLLCAGSGGRNGFTPLSRPHACCTRLPMSAKLASATLWRARIYSVASLPGRSCRLELWSLDALRRRGGIRVAQPDARHPGSHQIHCASQIILAATATIPVLAKHRAQVAERAAGSPGALLMGADYR